ncbi:methyltransferase [Pseudoduganella sp. FT55W]|uniref:Methyltransferase n=1 Tax=Duganella rivi TaxID=2666083 RepID=A0A7X4GUG5_9BURK|nr:class I SAM-dependent methyltransferase [Duganella rivi]MYM68819.1 methyltransferase [Duganella rivi]
MSDWTGGYVADIDYTYGYYQELNPLRVALAFANAGLEMPAMGTACELGFGQGMSANVHAAATVTEWHGTDFNPAQAAFAQEMAATAGSGARFVDQAFADYCARTDLPDFDFIGLHGIWSWVSDENRAIIVDFVRRKLKVGGVLYISYNTQPGWAPTVPLRGLLTNYAEVMAAPGAGIGNRIGAALDFADKLLETNPAFFSANPSVANRLKLLRTQNRNYVAHEYFNRDWQPMSFADMAELLGEAKLSYACSAHYVDHIESVNMTQPQRALLDELPDPVFRQSVRDFMVNQQFRRDYWVKGPRRQNPLQRSETIRRQRVILTAPRATISLKVRGATIEGGLNEAVYTPLLDILGDYKPHTLGQLEAALADRKINLLQVLEAALILGSRGELAMAQSPEEIKAATPASQRLNQKLFERARASDDTSVLASPVTGGGLQLGRINQLFLLAHSHGKRGAAAWTDFVWMILSAQNHRLIKDGATLQTAEDNVAELQRQAQEFEATRLPMYLALGVLA